MHDKIHELAEGFASCAPMLTAMGDETRQHLILEMLKMEQCNGVRVGDITRKTNLSRPAVSHHLRILREAGLISFRKEGTRNYYYFAPSAQRLAQLIKTLQLAANIAGNLPERSSKEF